MCGIAGIINFRYKPETRYAPLLMAESIAHRGPENSSVSFFYTDSIKTISAPYNRLKINIKEYNASLVHNRLSIIDLEKRSNQPFYSNDKKKALVYNGEIYNYKELREELIKTGYTFATKSDTEVVLYSLIAWGKDALHRFNGMFAFALWDTENQTLFCARDRFGIKPFFYSQTPNSFLFASEIKALFASKLVRRSAEKDRFVEYLFTGNVLFGENTFYRNIFRLKPGSCGILRNNNFSVSQWYNLIRPEKLYIPDIDKIRFLLDDSIRLRLRSDVPVSLCLSGGVDSGYIAASISKNNKLSYPLKSFTATLPVEKISGVNVGLDWKNARQTSSLAQSLHNEINIKQDLTLTKLIKYIKHQDQPVKSSGAFNQYTLFSHMQKHGIKVVLDGQGGDELFSGYFKYYGWILGYLASKFSFFSLIRMLAGSMIHGNFSIRNMLFHMFENISMYPRFLYNHTALSKLLSREILASHFEFLKKHSAKGSFFKKRLNEISGSQLPWLLHDEDLNSMAFSIESRLPFLDYRLVEYAYGIKPEWLMRIGWSKWPLRIAASQYLPDSITWNRYKSGFYFDVCASIPGISKYVTEWVNSENSFSLFINKTDINELQIESLPSHLTWRLLCMAAITEDKVIDYEM